MAVAISRDPHGAPLPLKPLCAALGQARLVIGLFEINNETIAYCVIFLYRFRLDYIVGGVHPFVVVRFYVIIFPTSNKKKVAAASGPRQSSHHKWPMWTP
ncbi:hypothetical protein SLA2020_350490 [Shorea laevis]